MINRIQSLRARKKMTLQELADSVGTTPSTINRLEKGQRRLTVDWMRKIAEALEVAPYELVEQNVLAGLSENADLYTPEPGGPLQASDHYIYIRVKGDDLDEHPDTIRDGSVVCFDLNDVNRAKIAAGKVVLVSLMDKTELAVTHGWMVGAFMPPNKVCSNSKGSNWLISLDDPALPYEPVIRGTLRFVIREGRN